ncbi:MAG: hypothetical protein RR482_06245, partial [Clostridia bacterium]
MSMMHHQSTGSRVLALLLTLLLLLPTASFAEEIAQPLFVVQLCSQDAQGNLVPLYEQPVFDVVDPHVWVQLPPELPLTMLYVQFLVPGQATILGAFSYG